MILGFYGWIPDVCPDSLLQAINRGNDRIFEC